MSFRVFWGLVFLILGISLIAHNFGYPILGEIWKLWPLILVYLGVKILLRSYSRGMDIRRRIKMKEERFKILKLVQEGKIKAEEAEELLNKLEETKKEEKRALRVNIVEGGKTKVNITIPLSLIRWGLKLAGRYGEVYGGKIDISPEEIENILNNPDFKGTIVDIYQEEENTRVVVEIL